MASHIQYGRPCPNSLFFLIPQSRAAKAAVECFHNREQRVNMQGETVLEVGHECFSKSNTTLACIGRTDADIVVAQPSISRLHLCFEVNPTTGVVMLVDRSSGGTTYVTGENSVGFRSEGPRRVVVLPGINDTIELGVDHEVVFKLKWIENARTDALAYARLLVNRLGQDTPSRRATKEVEGPDQPGEFAGASSVMVTEPSSTTCVELPGDPGLVPEFAYLRDYRSGSASETAAPSQVASRAPSPAPLDGDFYWASILKLRDGDRGEVHKCVNVHKGSIMIVKRLNKLATKNSNEWRVLKRQYEYLHEEENEHLLKLVTSRGWDEGPHLDLFFEVKEGNLGSLMESLTPAGSELTDIGLIAMEHALLGLEHLHYHRYIHGAINPHNILFSKKNHQYHFVLADFNGSTGCQVSQADSIYLAPELQNPRAYGRVDGRVNGKADIWALYVTIAQFVDHGTIRVKLNSCTPETRPELINRIAQGGRSLMTRMHGMAMLNSDHRWSAEFSLHTMRTEAINSTYPVGGRPREARMPPNSWNQANARMAMPSAKDTAGPPQRGITRQSTMDKAKTIGFGFARRLTGDMKNGILKGTRSTFRGR